MPTVVVLRRETQGTLHQAPLQAVGIRTTSLFLLRTALRSPLGGGLQRCDIDSQQPQTRLLRGELSKPSGLNLSGFRHERANKPRRLIGPRSSQLLPPTLVHGQVRNQQWRAFDLFEQPLTACWLLRCTMTYWVMPLGYIG